MTHHRHDAAIICRVAHFSQTPPILIHIPVQDKPPLGYNDGEIVPKFRMFMRSRLLATYLIGIITILLLFSKQDISKTTGSNLEVLSTPVHLITPNFTTS